MGDYEDEENIMITVFSQTNESGKTKRQSREFYLIDILHLHSLRENSIGSNNNKKAEDEIVMRIDRTQLMHLHLIFIRLISDQTMLQSTLII